MDANLLHISYEGNALEDPWQEAEDSMWTRSVDPVDAPNTPEYIEVEFEEGNAVALNGERLSPAVMLTKLNELGGKHGTLPRPRPAARDYSYALCSVGAVLSVAYAVAPIAAVISQLMWTYKGSDSVARQG